MSTTTTAVDMTLTLQVIEDAHKAALVLDGTPLDDGTLDRKTNAALTNRRLLNLADQLALASSLVRNEYWHGKDLTSYEL
jgi:hypothetical protein